jgi:hypothetical protein
MKETLKSIQTTFSAPTVPYPLPDGIKETIDSFLDRYSNIDDSDSQRFHEELTSLHTKHVAGSPDKCATFLHVLKAVRPALIGEARWNEWWDLVLKPAITSLGRKRNELEDARELILAILFFEDDQDKDGDQARLSQMFLGYLFDLYLARTRIPSPVEQVLSPEDEYVSQEIESILVAFGRRRPKELLAAADDLFVQKQYRIQALILLNAFVRLQTPHLHLVLETSLIQHLEKCLLIDTSSTVIGQALMILIMLLPHLTAALTSDHHLPKLFLIYSRVLCWDKFGSSEETTSQGVTTEDEDEDMVEGEEDAEPAWEKLAQLDDYTDASPPTLLHYYTFLYGLFPLNFMSFLRKPRKFLKSLNFPGADDFDLDQDLIQRRTEPYRRVHLLHPNMFTTTVDDELTENRWLKSDPADVVMECMDLCVAISTTLDDPGPPPTSKLPDLPTSPVANAPLAPLSLDDGTTVAGSPTEEASMAAKSELASPLLKCKDVIASPTLPPMKEATKKHNFLGAPIAMPQRLVVRSPTMDTLSNIVSSASPSPQSEFNNRSMAALQREIMLLRNDLNFERYMKSQHIAHIGQLQRKQIKEAAAEADTQNLINTNKNIKARIAKMHDQYGQLKKETLTSRSQSKRWEGELSGKVRSYRDEQKTWQGDEETLRFELNKMQSDCEHLKKIVEKAEAEQLRAQQRTKALEFELTDYDKIRQELEAAQDRIVKFENEREDYGLSTQNHNELRNEVESSHMQIASLQLERQRIANAYERRIMQLESKVQASLHTVARPGQLSPSVQQMLDSTLAASNAKMANLKKMYHRLQDQKTELEMQYHELQGEQQATLGRLRTYEKVEYPPERDTLSRNFSVAGPGNPSHAPESKYSQPMFSDVSTTSDGYSRYSDYQSPTSPSATASLPSRPSRQDSMPFQRSHHTQREPNGFSGPYDNQPSPQYQTQKPSETGHSSGSTYSAETNSSKERKERVAAKSEVRVFGRGEFPNKLPYVYANSELMAL